ncbi:Brp/Blh family beta-carotene 15,15'-dioxygenase [Fodinibius sp.]|uniref:Brp/Blh family beta-carotene 15,15'-dioxygenase n=1 Tax=Fodinibius sp. TaxID=1872440 RepID=UPI002ACE439A|nr:Brp/Blh family beta-carotene 15,15'-dioxygenase [Fodinibius sp.]MDZ7660143.1 Brp/Blh family beta-carotene 15,15'-dioxygenase [Fodinibius sp.]
MDNVTVSVSLIAILISILRPDIAEASKYYIFATVMLLVGIPHGAVDHIISGKMYDLSNRISDQLKFYLPYLTLMLLMGVIWYLSPITGFILFLLCTIYHFGQADFIHLNMPAAIKNGLYISRGFMIMGLVIFVTPSVSFPIMESIMNIEITAGSLIDQYSYEIVAVTTAQHFLLLAIATFTFRENLDTNSWYLLGDATLISALFWFAEPIIAFTIYFGFWHSLGHVKELKDFFSKQNKYWGPLQFAKDSWLFTIISIAGLWILYELNQAFGSEEQMLALLFILISALTLPHMIVVDLMFKTSNTTN